jgi:hypothetical protein
MTDKKKIVERIAKLFALGDAEKNTHEEEAMRAIEKAKQMMAEHNLEMSEIITEEEGKPASTIITGQETAYERSHEYFTKYEKWLGQTVMTITETRMIVRHDRVWKNNRTRPVVKLVFFGEVTDTSVAKTIYPILLKTLRKGARLNYGQGWRTEHRNYADGFAYRLMQKARSYKVHLAPEQATSVALVVQSKELVVKRDIMKAFPDLTPMRPSQMQTNDQDAFFRGMADGDRVNLNFRNTLKEEK